MGRYREVQTEQQEKSYEARIWWALWAIALIALAYTVWHQAREYDLVHNGQCIEAEYYVYNGQELAKYLDPDNRYHSYNVSGFDAVHDEQTIKLYYKDNINFAEPRRRFRSWLFSYLLFVPAFAGCSLRLHKIYRKN